MASSQNDTSHSSYVSFPQSSSVRYDQASDNALKANLCELRREGELTDFVIEVDGAHIECHKVILAASSEYFRTMFRTQMQESIQGKVSFNNYNSKVIEDIIEYLYTGKITITTENVEGLAQTCDLMQIEELKLACDKFMSKRVDPECCFGLLMVAKMYSLQNTYKACMQINLSDILELAPDGEFEIIGHTELQEFIARDELATLQEESVFELIVKWANFDLEKRGPLFYKLLEHVRLPLCSPEYLFDVIESCPLVNPKECYDLLNEAKKYHSIPDRRSSMESRRTKPRLGQRSLTLIVQDDDKMRLKCWSFASSDEYDELPIPLKTAHNNIQACVSGNNLFVALRKRQEGFHVTPETQHQNSIWHLDTSEVKWTTLPRLGVPRYRFSIVVVGRMLFAIGGHERGGSVVNTVERLTLPENTWEMIEEMPKRRFCVSSVAVGRKIYVFGGTKAMGGPSLDTFQYDITSNLWQKKTKLPYQFEGRGIKSSCTLNGKVYAFFKALDEILCYDPECDNWSSIFTSLPDGHFQATPFMGQILVAHYEEEEDDTDTGDDDDGPAFVTELFDPASNTWNKSPVKLPYEDVQLCVLTS